MSPLERRIEALEQDAHSATRGAMAGPLTPLTTETVALLECLRRPAQPGSPRVTEEEGRRASEAVDAFLGNLATRTANREKT